MKGEIITKYLLFLFLLLATNAICQSNSKKLVYINGNRAIINIETNSANIYVDNKITSNEIVKKGIGLFIAYNLSNNIKESEMDLIMIRSTGCKLNKFVKKYKNKIVNAIYYIERYDSGDLVELYGRDAYSLLDLNILQPEINVKKRLLLKSGMKLIDIDANIKVDSLERIK